VVVQSLLVEYVHITDMLLKHRAVEVVLDGVLQFDRDEFAARAAMSPPWGLHLVRPGNLSVLA
jgi:hypothetical protein